MSPSGPSCVYECLCLWTCISVHVCSARVGVGCPGRRDSGVDLASVGTGCSGESDRGGDSGEEEEAGARPAPEGPFPLMIIGLGRRSNRLYANGVLLAPSCGSFVVHPGHGYLLFTALGAQPYVQAPLY